MQEFFASNQSSPQGGEEEVHAGTILENKTTFIKSPSQFGKVSLV